MRSAPDEDNLSLSDRRAESVAVALSQQFGVPAENLTTQGYGEQCLKVPAKGRNSKTGASRSAASRHCWPVKAGVRIYRVARGRANVLPIGASARSG